MSADKGISTAFRDAICAVCKGELYPRQCRNSHAWRLDKAVRFDDLRTVDFPCPFGKELNDLPIGDNAPAQVNDRTGPEAAIHRKFTCKWGVLMTCCEVACYYDGQVPPLMVVRAHCWPNKCKYFEAA